MHPENLERYLLPFVLARPKFSRLEGEFDIFHLLHNTLKLIQCWEYAPVTTQLQKFNDASISRLVPPSSKLLEYNCQSEGKATEG